MSPSMRWFGGEVKLQVSTGTNRGILRAALHVLQKADVLVPLDEGTLFESGGTDLDSLHHRASIYYDTPYAVRQHEEMDFQHAPGRQAKYLETPITDKGVQAECLAIIREETAAGMEG